MSSKKRFALIILDGLGQNDNPKGNAVYHAKKPTLDKLFANYPYTFLTTHGKRVGLPEGQMGNSEVGHLNIGAGRVVVQDLVRISNAIKDNTLFENQKLNDLFTNLGEKTLHFIGLVSRGGVHSDQQHLLGLINIALTLGVKNIAIHAITDGRDRPPNAAKNDLAEFSKECEELKSKFPSANVNIVSLVGRYFAMDRDNRWERTKVAFELFNEAKGQKFNTVADALQHSYDNNISDEFIKASTIGNVNTRANNRVADGDLLFFFNFRTDRVRQIVSCFTNPELNNFATNPAKVRDVITLTEYDENLKTTVLFETIFIKNNLGEFASNNNLTQLRIAETEKYPHVTYFFNGGVEKIYPGESRIMVPSPKDVPTYDLKPEMSAFEVTAKLIDFIEKKHPELIVLNFANCDMVGHTGVFEAAVKAVETVDQCLGKVLIALEKYQYSSIITADHGNAEQMIDYQTNTPHTFHTTYPVPLFLVSSEYKDVKLRNSGALCDISPTACQLLALEKPKEMIGESLIVL